MLNDLLASFSTETEKLAYLSALTAAHPYFASAQFALLQHTPADDAAYAQRAATTALLFGNPYWLQFQLNKSAATLPPAQNMDTAAPTVTDEAGDTEPPVAMPPVVNTVQEPETVAVTEQVPEDDAALTNNDLPPMTISIPGPEAATATTLSFEPLHMVDYFASQGIKLSDELQGNDKLGRQLKSFTEWLKSMKKTHPEAATAQEATAADIAIQSLAVRSNKPDNVVTESMAEVLALQGKRQKAIAIYEKLSLLNPGKSAYFAAKIQHLKGN